MTSPTPDFPDWAQPVAQIETDKLLLNAQLVASGGTTGQIDTTGYNSVALAFDNDGAVGGNPRCVAHVIWSIGSVVAWQDTVSFHIGASYGSQVDPIYLQAPARGSRLNIQVFTDSGDGLKITAYGSTRQVDGPQISGLLIGGGKLVLDTGSVNVAAGASSATFRVPPVTSKLLISFHCSAAIAATLLINGISNYAATLGVEQLLRLQTGGVISVTQEMSVAGVALELTMINNDAAARNLHAEIWDMSR